MKTKKKNIVILILIILIILISLVLYIKIININKEYPPANIIEKNINENIQLNNISFSVGKSEFKDKKYLIDNYKDDLKNLYLYVKNNELYYDIDKFNKENEDKFIVVPIHIIDTCGNRDLAAASLQKFIENSHISVNYDTNQSNNFIPSNFKDKFKETGEVNFSLVFQIQKSKYKYEEFDLVEKETIYFINGIYPEQIKIRLQ